MKAYSEINELQNLPIFSHLHQICSKLKNSKSHFLVLTAQTAAGKSTGLPLALMQEFPKKILMLEPRRLAVLSVAKRCANLLDEDCGQSVGYQMFLENAVSEQTKLKIITEALLTRQIQTDPSLEDVSVVVLDEFHERSIHSDLAFALLQESMQLRDDLFVVIMSATMDTNALCKKIPNTEVYNVPGRQFPVEISYHPDLSTTNAIISLVNQLQNNKFSTSSPQDCGKLSLVNINNNQKSRSILVFLPGIAQIHQVQNELLQEKINLSAEILILHSSISLQEQKKVLQPSNNSQIRIILSSAIAETSLTVPDVVAVIDCGLARINRLNPNAGMESLVTEKESNFSAEQRAGRAGRIQKGICWRLWNKNEVLASSTQCEIQRADLCALVLESYLWGIKSADALNWLDAPPTNSWNSAVNLLKLLGIILPNDSLSDFAKKIPLIGLHPRLARIALAGASPELILKYSSYKEAPKSVQEKFIQNISKRIKKLNLTEQECPLHKKDSYFLLCGFPDRLAQQSKIRGVYQFPSGRMASLPKETIQNTAVLPQWIVATQVLAGETEGRIYEWDTILNSDAEIWTKAHSTTSTKVEFSEENKVIKTKYTTYGKIILSSVRLSPDSEDTKLAICNAVKTHGLQWLPLSSQAKNFLLRAQFYQQQSAATGIPPLKNSPDEQSLVNSVEEWLTPFLTGGKSITSQTVLDALRYHLDASSVDLAAPEHFTLPNGRKAKLIYQEQDSKIIPVLEVIIQRIFGCMQTPHILQMPILLKLLSPARRPLQITSDLEGFWQNTWPQICKEMKGRYPKHNWDYRVVVKED